VLINCRHKEHNVLKQIIDPKKKMILATQTWTNFFEELEVIIRSKIACNGRRVKTSGIVLMTIIKRIANYHIGTCHNTSY